MARVPAFAKAFAGRWRVVEMDNWAATSSILSKRRISPSRVNPTVKLIGPLKGFLDVRYGAREGSACAEFSWEGREENDQSKK
jgi:hypothetical protein